LRLRHKTFMINIMKRRGFTLIELMVVIVVMGALLILNVVNLRGSQANARDVERKTDIETIASHLETYYTVGSDTTPTIGRYPSTTLITGTASSLPVKVLVVGGGGGGNGGTASYYGSGGGGGTVIYNSTYSLTTGAKTVTIGNGGSGLISGTPGSGGNSVFDTLTANGGTGTINTSRTGGSNTNYSGGTASTNADSGGGAGGGTNGSVSTPGIGYLSSINGTSTYYGGGGGGIALIGSYTGLSGGLGGGGNGNTSTAGGNGTINTGGGGGGANMSYAGGNGGSGIVIISYPSASMTATGGTITYTDANNQNSRSTSAYPGGNTIHTFTSSGTFTVTAFTTYSTQGILRDLDTASITAPGVSSWTQTFIAATNTAQSTDINTGINPRPSINQYVYQPLQTDGSLCTYESQECRKFNLYYHLESDDTVYMVTSKNQ
jgi:prepilin-type N-terminal cleavage/methylation domain-containing protein